MTPSLMRTCVALALTLGFVPSALAQPAGDEPSAPQPAGEEPSEPAQAVGDAGAPAQTAVEDADALIQQGVELRRQREDARALELFRRAHELSPSGRALAQIALAEQAMGEWAAAHEHLVEALSQEADAWVAERRAALETALADIRTHLGQLDLPGGVPGAEVRVDGVVRGTLPLEEPLWVPAGELVVEVRAEGHHPFTRTVSVSAGSLARQRVRLVAIASEESGPSIPEESEPVDSQRGGSALPVVGGVLLGVGAISLGVGIGFHVVREDNAAQFNGDGCLTVDRPRGEVCSGQLAAAQDAEIAMGVGYVGAGLLAGTGLVLLLVGSAGSGESATAFNCGAGPGEIGFGCSGRF